MKLLLLCNEIDSNELENVYSGLQQKKFTIEIEKIDNNFDIEKIKDFDVLFIMNNDDLNVYAPYIEYAYNNHITIYSYKELDNDKRVININKNTAYVITEDEQILLDNIDNYKDKIRENKVTYGNINNLSILFYLTKDPEIRNYLILYYMNLMEKYAQKTYKNVNMEYEDYLQYCYENLIKLVDTHNPYKFPITTAIAEISKKKSKTFNKENEANFMDSEKSFSDSLETILDKKKERNVSNPNKLLHKEKIYIESNTKLDQLEDVVSNENLEEKVLLSIELNRFLKSLTNEREKRIIYLRYIKGYTLREVADMYQLTDGRIQKIERTAFMKIRRLISFEITREKILSNNEFEHLFDSLKNERNKEIMILRYIKGYTLKEVADMYQLSEGKIQKIERIVLSEIYSSTPSIIDNSDEINELYSDYTNINDYNSFSDIHSQVKRKKR